MSNEMLMEAGEYQIRCGDTAIYPEVLENVTLAGLLYSLSGLSGEVGELMPYWPLDVDNIKKDEELDALLYELGDVSWYIARSFTHLDVSMQAEVDRAERALFGVPGKVPMLLEPYEFQCPESALAKYALLIHNASKKIIRDDGSVLKPERYAIIMEMMRKILEAWMLCCRNLGLDFRNVLAGNIEKLTARQKVGTLQGDGDNR